MAEIEELAQAIREAKEGDPLAPVTVAVPSNYAGLAVRRRLGRELGGLVNVNFINLPRVAELLGAPVLAAQGLKPLSRAIRIEAVRAALSESPGDFAAVAEHAATVEALDRTFADVRSCSDAALDTIAATSRRAAEVVRVYRATRARLAGRYYDEHDLAAAAEGDIGALLVYLPRTLAPPMQSMVERLGARVIARDTSANERADRVISALDPDDEVRAAIRIVVEKVRAGTPLHRIALLWPTDEPYAAIVHQQLDAAAIPHNGPSTRTLGHTVTGAALTHLLGLTDRRLRRDDVIAWLASAPIVEIAGEKGIAPASAWDGVSRAAGVVEGAAQWHARLTAYAADQAEYKRTLIDDSDEDPDAARIERVDTRIDRALRLRTFVAELAMALDAGERHTWTALSEWTCALVDRYLGDESRHYTWPDHEQEAWRDIRAALEQLAVLDDVGGPVDVARFRHAVDAELAAPATRHGKFGTGVFAANVRVALGTDFDTVVIVGFAEGSLPGRRAEDALLPDAERRTTDEIAQRADRIVDEWFDFQSALASAGDGERVLVFPRTDPRRRRELLPSRWLPPADDVGREFIDSYQQGVAGGAPASLSDYDVRGLLEWSAQGGDALDHTVAAETPSFAAGLVASDARTRPQFTRFDGNVGDGMVDPFGPDTTHSPTSLEAYANCPMQYFFSKVLGLGPPEKPEEIRRISPMNKGSLMHDVLEKFVLAALSGPATPSEAELLDLAEAAFDDYQSRGLTGSPLLWRYERELMRRELKRFYADDVADDATPLAAELGFGGRSREVPVVLTLPDGRQVGFRGKADRVDRLADGGLRVTDYKTGSGYAYREITQDDPFLCGTKLQLPLYGLAARATFGQADTPVTARYWVVSEKSGYAKPGIAVDDATLERFTEVLGTLVDGITAGRFPARPGEENWQGGWEHCNFCDFDTVCQADRDRAWERVRDASELASYVALVEPEVIDQ